jgi:hypothetical protein
MTLSPPTNNRPDTRSSCWLAAGSVHARIDPPDRTAVMPPIRSRKLPSVRSPLRAHPSLKVKRAARLTRSNLLKQRAAAKSP